MASITDPTNFDTEYKTKNPHNDVGILVDRNRALAGEPAFFINTTDGKRLYGESPEDVINKFETNPVGEKKKNSDDIGVGVLIDRKHKRKGHLYFIELKSGCRVYADSVINVVKALHNINDKSCSKRSSRPSTASSRPSRPSTPPLISSIPPSSFLSPPSSSSTPPSSSLIPPSSSSTPPSSSSTASSTLLTLENCRKRKNFADRQGCLEKLKQQTIEIKRKQLEKERLSGSPTFSSTRLPGSGTFRKAKGGSRTKSHRKKSRSSSRKKFKR